MKYHVPIFAPFLFEAVEASLDYFFEIEMSTSQNFKTTFKYNLTCILVSLRAKLISDSKSRTPLINCRKKGK